MTQQDKLNAILADKELSKMFYEQCDKTGLEIKNDKLFIAGNRISPKLFLNVQKDIATRLYEKYFAVAEMTVDDVLEIFYYTGKIHKGYVRHSGNNLIILMTSRSLGGARINVNEIKKIRYVKSKCTIIEV
jgi:hypothetical protein